MSPNSSGEADRILVVDDSPDNLFLIQATLEDQGYQIALAEDGKSALRQVGTFLPHLILLDVMMPEMDGYEVTRRIRANPDLPFIPILLVTAHEQSDVVTGLDAGADDFIRKPFDIDEVLARVRSQLRLKHTVDERERLYRQQEDFVSRLTHDLRTPLVAADRMLSLFLQGTFGTVTPEMQEALTAMIRSNQNLLQMVNTILEVYRHDAGSKTLNFSSCDLWELIEEVVNELSPLAEKQGLSLNIEPEVQDDREPIQVMGDRIELRRVFTNLIGNAIKFTDQGSVRVVLNRPIQQPALERDGASRRASTWAAIAIEDTGRGIPPEDQATLFQRFRSGKHKRSGSGLGLYLSSQIIEAHGGILEAESTVGQGSRFTVRLPATPQASIAVSR